MKHCAACGAEAPRDAEHCAHCPASFPAEEPRPHPVVSRPKKRPRLPRLPPFPPWAYAAVALAAVGMVYCGSRGTRPPARSSESGRFDPAADAERDLLDAIVRAKVSRRRVLVVVGGNWAIWCRRMEEFFTANPDLAALRDGAFVVVRVAVTPEKPNAAALSRFPPVASYPYIFVLDENEVLLASTDAAELRSGADYDRVRFGLFLRRWAPPP